MNNCLHKLDCEECLYDEMKQYFSKRKIGVQENAYVSVDFGEKTLGDFVDFFIRLRKLENGGPGYIDLESFMDGIICHEFHGDFFGKDK